MADKRRQPRPTPLTRQIREWVRAPLRCYRRTCPHASNADASDGLGGGLSLGTASVAAWESTP